MIRVYNGDCLEIMSSMENNSIDLILTDPPYIISRKTNFSKGGGNQSKFGIELDEKYYNECKKWEDNVQDSKQNV